MPFSKKQIQDLLEGVELNEGAVERLVSLVEAAVEEKAAEKDAEKEEALKAKDEEHKAEKEELSEKAQAYGDYIKEEVSQKAEAYGNYIKEEVVSRVSDYTDYAVNEFIKEHQEKFERLELYERMKSAFEGAKTAFEENGFPLNENVQIEKMKSELNEASTAFNTLFEELTQTREKLQTAEMALLFEVATTDLSATQKEKIKTLSESVSFDTVDEFKTGLTLLIEQVRKPVQASSVEVLNESVRTVAPGIEAVLKALGGNKKS